MRPIRRQPDMWIAVNAVILALSGGSVLAADRASLDDLKQWDEVKTNDELRRCLDDPSGLQGCLYRIKFTSQKYLHWASSGSSQFIPGRGLVEFHREEAAVYAAHVRVVDELLEGHQSASVAPLDAGERPREVDAPPRGVSSSAPVSNGRRQAPHATGLDLNARIAAARDARCVWAAFSAKEGSYAAALGLKNGLLVQVNGKPLAYEGTATILEPVVKRSPQANLKLLVIPTDEDMRNVRLPDMASHLSLDETQHVVVEYSFPIWDAGLELASAAGPGAVKLSPCLLDLGRLRHEEVSPATLLARVKSLRATDEAKARDVYKQMQAAYMETPETLEAGTVFMSSADKRAQVETDLTEAKTLLAANRTVEARRHVEHALLLDPENAAAKEQLTKIEEADAAIAAKVSGERQAADNTRKAEQEAASRRAQAANDAEVAKDREQARQIESLVISSGQPMQLTEPHDGQLMDGLGLSSFRWAKDAANGILAMDWKKRPGASNHGVGAMVYLGDRNGSIFHHFSVALPLCADITTRAFQVPIPYLRDTETVGIHVSLDVDPGETAIREVYTEVQRHGCW